MSRIINFGYVNAYGLLAMSPFGFIGHTCSLVTFSSKTLRTTSTGFLFILLTLCDILYLSIMVPELMQELGTEILRSEVLCRSRPFIFNTSTVISAWLLVLIAIDRLIRVRFPFQQAQLCTRKVAACMTAVVCICAAVFTYHVLQPEFTFTNPITSRCGPNRTNPTSYSIFYYNTWPILQLIFTYVLPSICMSLFLIGVYSKMRQQQTVAVASLRREKQQRQMLILMISSVVWFIICTLPYGTFRIILQRIPSTSTTSLVSNILNILRNMNYCFNFYLHCLTSQLFRSTFIQQFKRFTMWSKRRVGYDSTVIHPMTTITVRARGLPTTNRP